MSAPAGLRRTGQKTYWHLGAGRRLPSQYEIGSSRLHYYREHGFAVNTPISAWYRRYQTGSPLQHDDWEAFSDPRSTTYASYTKLMRDREAFVDGLFELGRRCPDTAFSPSWIESLDRAFSPLRFPIHALMMSASYLGSMAPAGKITIAAAFQAADQMRRVHAIARRLADLRTVHPVIAATSRERWEHDEAWQPLRELVERLLVTYDWGECFAALCLSVGPALDELVLRGLARRARREGDELTCGLLCALAEDGTWHRQWAAALTRYAIDGRNDNRAILAQWTEVWGPRVDAAVVALAPQIADEDAVEEARAAGSRLLLEAGSFR